MGVGAGECRGGSAYTWKIPNRSRCYDAWHAIHFAPCIALYCLQDSWSATVQLVLLVGTAVVALGLVPLLLLLLTTNRFLLTTVVFSPAKTPTASTAAAPTGTAAARVRPPACRSTCLAFSLPASLLASGPLSLRPPTSNVLSATADPPPPAAAAAVGGPQAARRPALPLPTQAPLLHALCGRQRQHQQASAAGGGEGCAPCVTRWRL